MNFIALVIGLLLERLLGEHTHLRDPAWFRRYSAWLEGVAGGNAYWSGPLGVLLLVGLPTAAVGVVYSLLGGALLSVLALVFSIAVLLFSMGPRDLDAEATAYLEAVEAGDETRATEQAAAIVGATVEAVGAARDRAVAEALLVQFNERTFGVVFWFVLLGPLGAALYRSAVLASRMGTGKEDAGFAGAAQRLQGILDWLPARAIALGFALAGSFEEAVTDWKACPQRGADQFWESNSDVIVAAGCGALRMTGEEAEAEATNSVRAALALILRTLILWVVIFGLVTIGGFAYS